MHSQIPLTRAMQASVRRCDEHGIVLHAPLVPNLNHKHTAFGGSLSTLATLAGWMMTEVLLEEAGIAADVVIQSGETRFVHPVEQDFSAWCPRPAAEALARFLDMLTRHGKGKLDLHASIAIDTGTGTDAGIAAGIGTGQEALHFSGRYVALRTVPSTS